MLVIRMTSVVNSMIYLENKRIAYDLLKYEIITIIKLILVLPRTQYWIQGFAYNIV